MTLRLRRRGKRKYPKSVLAGGAMDLSVRLVIKCMIVGDLDRYVSYSAAELTVDGHVTTTSGERKIILGVNASWQAQPLCSPPYLSVPLLFK